MNITPQHTIVTMGREHRDSTIELFTKTFCDREPITHHLHITYEDYQPFVVEVIDKGIRDKMSKVAVDKNNKVIACVIAEDIADLFSPNFSHYPKLKPIFDILEETSKPFLAGKQYKKGRVAHLWIAAIEEDLMGQGLFSALNAETIKMAANNGFEFAYAEFTNEISEKITNQFKIIQLCHRVNYDDFALESGEKPFKGVRGGSSAYVAAIRPGVKLESLKESYTSQA